MQRETDSHARKLGQRPEQCIDGLKQNVVMLNSLHHNSCLRSCQVNSVVVVGCRFGNQSDIFAVDRHRWRLLRASASSGNWHGGVWYRNRYDRLCTAR